MEKPLPNQEEINRVLDELFRRESGRIIAVLTKIFSPINLGLSEDLVHDAFIEAMKVWTQKGIPDNPTSWLYTVARNKTLNNINREKYKRKYISEVGHLLESRWTAQPAWEYLFSEEEILDDQLRMMFICCHPAISRDSQVALTLKTLCGFSIGEVARAFLTTNETIHKRLVRARQKIRKEKISFEMPVANELESRLQAVLETNYLVFNEGYSASTGSDLIRYELCREAMRLTEMIAAHPSFQNNHDVFALLALMQLNASRFESRLGRNGTIITMEKQIRSQWDYSLMEKGFKNLAKSTSDSISVYHILAAISAYHCSAADYQSTDWHSILGLYDKLLLLDSSPIVLLNRAVAVSKVRGAKEAILESKKIGALPAMQRNHLFYATVAEFHTDINQFNEAASFLAKAIELAPTNSEKTFLEDKLKNALKKINSLPCPYK